jgi:hypothetical protein
MTLRLLLGCNSASLLGIRLITLLWRGVVRAVAAEVVEVAQEAYLRLQFLYLLVLFTQLPLVLVGLR